MESPRWTDITKGIKCTCKRLQYQHASFIAKHSVGRTPDWGRGGGVGGGTYDVEAIRQARPEEITADECDKYIRFWNDPKNLARAEQNWQNRQKSVVISQTEAELKHSGSFQEVTQVLQIWFKEFVSGGASGSGGSSGCGDDEESGDDEGGA
ncbi:hypothetical protein Tco_0959561 [Tanacetum coccineum]